MHARLLAGPSGHAVLISNIPDRNDGFLCCSRRTDLNGVTADDLTTVSNDADEASLWLQRGYVDVGGFDFAARPEIYPAFVTTIKVLLDLIGLLAKNDVTVPVFDPVNVALQRAARAWRGESVELKAIPILVGAPAPSPYHLESLCN